MHFADHEPMDIPPPPTVDTAAEMFGAPVIGFVAQPSLSELGVGTVGSSTNGRSRQPCGPWRGALPRAGAEQAAAGMDDGIPKTGAVPLLMGGRDDDENL
jgi:hypothetical protein